MEEASIIGSYLLGGKIPIKKAVVLYQKAVEIKKIEINERERKLWKFLKQNKWSIGFVDSALAFIQPSSSIRKQMLIMCAILESMPEYANLFLPKSRNFFYHFYIVGIGLKVIFKTIFGIILIKLI